MVENMLLITPLLYAYDNVQKRHQFLEETIGPVEEENKVMTRFQFLVIC